MNVPIKPAGGRITKARTQLLLREPFFGCILMHLQEEASTDYPTFATDGTTLFYNPDYVDQITDEEIKGVLAHEAMHVAHNHHTRRGHRNPEDWNEACDLAINPDLIEQGFHMPGQPAVDPNFTGLSAEAIYAQIQVQKQQDQHKAAGQGTKPSTSPGLGEVKDAAPAHDPAALKAAAAKAQTMVRQARMMARKKQGGLSSSLERQIETMVEPVVDWRQILRSFIDDRQQTDFSWLRPNRRLIPQGIYIPGQIPDGISHVVLAIDTSGSIDQNALASFASEIEAAIQDGAIQRLTVVYADREVKGHVTFEAMDDFTIQPVGGGGTSFASTFEWIEDNADDAVAVIYFTDLVCRDFGMEPHCPVLWATWGDERRFPELAAAAPFGEAIFLSNR
ncbi:putative gp25 [Roseibium sp. TrichSKD4]|uniref:vWA domain-containing protein n=1 Tax=Roseibium sp. TrichSKD4 TaxID=744980 RepID=UPI0001E56B47|nr:VWA-like domain-containing protein [Roseibium sp. TrichSKD4]EFO30115.1 putative gp25 [Roseibium sp. TrichSKD4]